MKLLRIRSGNLQTSAKISFHILLSIFLVCMSLPLGWSSEDTGKTVDDKVLEGLVLFSEVLGQVHRYHLETPDNQKIIEGAIKGMLRELDPYSQFIPDYLKISDPEPRQLRRTRYGHRYSRRYVDGHHAF